MILRPYQEDAVESVLSYWQDGGGNPLVDMATGTGKSLVIGALTKRVMERWPGLRVLMLTHVRELISQNAQALLRYWPQAPIGINSAGLGRRDTQSPILFAGIKSVYRKANMLGHRDLVLIDETHLVPREGEGMYLKLIEGLRNAVPDLRIAGFSATCFRLDSGRLDDGDGRIFDDIVYSYGIAQGVADKWLAPLRGLATSTEIDVSGVSRRGGDFVSGSLEAAADKEDVVAGAADEMVLRGADRRTWLAFCCGVKHAYHVAEALRERGVSCATVTGETPSGERDQMIKSLRNGQLRCLTNVSVLTTGVDVPNVDLIAMLNPTLSTGRYVQILGRGTRKSPGKVDCRVLDFAGNIRRHGPVDAIHVKVKKNDRNQKDCTEKTEPDSVRAKICPSCQHYNAISDLTCINCDYQWPEQAPKHSPVASSAPVMTAEIKDTWIKVDSVQFSRHQSHDQSKPDTLRVDYNCGFNTYSEWVCLEHPLGYAKARAQGWFEMIYGTKNMVGIDHLIKYLSKKVDMPNFIQIMREGKYWKIIAYRIDYSDLGFYDYDQNFKLKHSPKLCLT